MILGIDASNIREGGGVTHLAELLRAADPRLDPFTSVVVWAGARTLARIEPRPWLVKVADPLLDGPLPTRVYWQLACAPARARAAGCDVLLSPGAAPTWGFEPYVSMSQNMLPFQVRELLRFGISLKTAKLILLRASQTRSFHKAAGVIFLSNGARDIVTTATRGLPGDVAVIPHGVDDRFRRGPRSHRPVRQFTSMSPCRVIYVSKVDPYKHHCNVVAAVALLRSAGHHIALDVVGPSGNGSRALAATTSSADPDGSFVHIHGPVPYDSLPDLYARADLGVFASTCENLPIALLEMMASGLPIACSSRSPMPEVLSTAGVYFDPEAPSDIARSLEVLLRSHELRADLSNRGQERAQVFSWRRCANETFTFLSSFHDRKPSHRSISR